MDVLLLAGGTSAEREISLRSGQNAANALRSFGHQVTLFDPQDAVLTANDVSGIDVVFLALHGTGGEDGQIQSLLDALKIPYTGSNAEASRIAFHKQLAKQRFVGAGLATPNAVEFRVDDPLEEILERASNLTFPWFVKPAAQGSSLGVSRVINESDLGAAVDAVRQFDDIGLIEEAITGTEWTIGLFETVSFPPVSIESGSDFYSYAAKYSDRAASLRVGSGSLTEAERQLIATAREAYAAVGASGLARVDFICDSEQNPWILEVNTIPGLTDTSSIPKAAAAFGWSLGELCERMCAAAIERHIGCRWSDEGDD